MFILQPYGGMDYFAMDQWNAYARSWDSVWTESDVEYTASRVSYVPAYGAALGGRFGSFTFLLDVRPISLRREISAKWFVPLYQKMELSGAIFGVNLGVTKGFGNLDFSAYLRLLYPYVRLSFEESWIYYDYYRLTATMKPSSFGGGLALEIAYRVHPLISVGFNAGYDHLVLWKYRGDATYTVLDPEGKPVKDSTLTNEVLVYFPPHDAPYFSAIKHLYIMDDLHLPWYFKDNLSGTRLRFFVRLNLGGGR